MPSSWWESIYEVLLVWLSSAFEVYLLKASIILMHVIFVVYATNKKNDTTSLNSNPE